MRCTRRQWPRYPVRYGMLCRPLSQVSYGVGPQGGGNALAGERGQEI